MSYDELGRDARSFLSSARGAHDAPAGAKDRVRLGLAAALSAPAATGATVALGVGARARWLTFAKLAAAVVIVGAGAGAIASHFSSTSHDPGRASALPAKSPSSLPALPPPAVVAEVPSSPPPSFSPPAQPIEAEHAAAAPVGAGTGVASPIGTAAAPAPRHPTATALPARNHDAVGEGSVAAEVALRRRASASLRAGDPRGALAAVSEHARRFPNGALAEERDTERIVALCALGQVDDAQRARGRFERMYPSSSHEGRVRAACASPAAPASTSTPSQSTLSQPGGAR
jgi:hypothetical protein